jgi:hypothetical protein
MEHLIEDKRHDTFSETGIREAIKNNTIYKKYRWVLVEKDQDPDTIHDIQPTIISKKAGCTVILELDTTKTNITGHSNSLNVMSQTFKMTISNIKKIIENGTLYKDHYYIYLENCSPELLETYDTTLFKYVPKCAVKIKSIHPETKQEQIFPSLRHAYEFCKVHHKTVRKAIDEKKLLNGFFWELA